MDSKKLSLYFRTAVIIALLLTLCGYFWWLSYDAIVNNAIDPSESNRINLITSTETVTASRGHITDRYGRNLVTNKTEYVVTLDVEAMGDAPEQAAVIRRLIEICKDQGIEWTDKEFPVTPGKGPYEFTTETPYHALDSEGKTVDTRLYKLASEEKWIALTTGANQLVRNMQKYFALDKVESLSEAEARSILGVLYSCYLRSHEILWTDYFFAEDVDIDFISIVKEEDLPGVTIKPTTKRQYETDFAAVLLGQTGAISAEKWETLKDRTDVKYNMNDIIGLSGMESAFEKYLKGTDGKLLTTYDAEGNKLSEEYIEMPQAGNNVAVTLDIGLQEATEKALSDLTDKINLGAGGSAAVVIDIHSGEVLAAATYPTFSAKTYLEDYEDLVKDKRKPLYNRAFLGTYAPGSTYKICTASAISNYGIASQYSSVQCSGVMKYGDTNFHCWYRRGHGVEMMDDAIRDSCNIYFYTLGEKLGIQKQKEQAQAYGLGLPTGIELTENTGVNAGPEYSEKVGTIWYQGNTLSAAIGQSDNQFTILQLANYIATFINGGTHYNAHLLKNVKTSDNTAIVCNYEDTVESPVINEVPLSEGARAAIKKGMGEVIAADDLDDIFQDLTDMGIKIGCKTGTAQLGKTGRYNGLFVSFAPYEDPEIAICTIVEKATSGAATSKITAKIYEYYFSEKATLERVEAENALLH